MLGMDALQSNGLNQDSTSQLKQGTIISGDIDEDEEDWTTVAMYEEEDYFSEDDEDDQEEEEDEYIDQLSGSFDNSTGFCFGDDVFPENCHSKTEKTANNNSNKKDSQ